MLDFTASTMNDRGRSSIVSMDTFGERLKRERQLAGLTQQDLADAAGVTKQAISQIEKSTTSNPEAKTLAPIAKRLGLSMTYLMSGRGPRTSEEDPDWTDIVAFKTAASMGPGAPQDDYMVTHKLKFRRDSLARKRLNPERLGVVYGRGDSMLPRIRSGDALLFDRSDTTPQDGLLYVISYGKDLFAKELIEIGGRWFINSLNRDDPKWRKPVQIDGMEHFEIHGRVRWIGSWED